MKRFTSIWPLWMLVACMTLLFLCSGCTTAQAVPKARFHWNPRTGNVDIISPKNAELQNTVITVAQTNGMKFVQITIGSYKTQMDPEVIKESAAGTTAMIQASGQLGAQMFALGLQSAMGASGVPRLPPPAQPAPPARPQVPTYFAPTNSPPNR